MATRGRNTTKPAKTAKKTDRKNVRQAPSAFDFTRFGESYSSLILGIIVVIVGTVLLLSLVRGRNATQQPGSRAVLQNTGTTISDDNEVSFSKDERIISSATKRPDPTEAPVASPTATKAPTPTPTATPIPTKKVETKPTVTQMPTKAATPTKKPDAPKAPAASKPEVVNPGGSYTIKEGDTLWSIAEKTYKSGYNWVDIARANKLSNPDAIENGTKLTLPKVEQKNATSEPEWTGSSQSANMKSAAENKISGNKYTVKSGDTLWDIAVRSYGDGYQWNKLQSANKLSNPDLILEGSSVSIPR